MNEKDINPVLNIYINQNDTEEDFMNSKDIANKYGVECEDSDQDEACERKEEHSDTDIRQQINDTTEIAHRMDSLLVKLENKNREVERLCTLLEAVTIVPGIDPAKYLDIYDERGEEAVVSANLLLNSLGLSSAGSPRY